MIDSRSIEVERDRVSFITGPWGALPRGGAFQCIFHEESMTAWTA